jgi:hypothetical protein
MSGIGEAQAKIISGLKEFAPSLSSNDAGNISKAFFPIFDGVARFNSDQQNIVADVALDYAKGIHTARQNLNLDVKSNIALLRRIASEKLANADLNLPVKAFKGIDYAIQSTSSSDDSGAVLKYAPAPVLDYAHQETTNGINSHSEVLDTTEDLTGKSTQHAKAALDATVTKIADSLEPIMQAMASTPDDKKHLLLDQILKTFGFFKDDTAGDVDLNRLDKIKQDLGEVMKDFSLEKFNTFLKKLEPAERQALGAYMKNVLAPILAGGHGPMVAQNIPEKFYAPMSASLKAFENTLPSRPSEPSASEISLVSEKRNLISQALVLIAKEAQANLRQNPNYDIQAHFNREIPKLIEVIQLQFGADTVIFKDDIQAISSHLDNVKNTPKTKQNSDVQAFLSQYGKYALMAVPLILGPIATLISKVPIIGGPIASLAPFINQTADKFGPMLIGMFFASRNGDSQAEPSANTTTVASTKGDSPSRKETTSSVALGA